MNLVHHYRNNERRDVVSVTRCLTNGMRAVVRSPSSCRISRHREDPTRPVTQGMDAPDAVVNNNMAAVMDVAGFNYRPFRYQVNYKKLPQQIILGSRRPPRLAFPRGGL